MKLVEMLLLGLAISPLMSLASRADSSARAPATAALKELARIANSVAACEEEAARDLSLASDEPAEIIAKAAIAACYGRHYELVRWRRKYERLMTPEQEDARDQSDDAAAIKFLALDVIKERARGKTSPPP